MACNACWYLIERGDTRTGLDLASGLAPAVAGPAWGRPRDSTVDRALLSAWALRAMGRYAEARDLAQHTLDRRRRVLGEDHPDTLTSATDLAIDLRDLRRVSGRPRPGPRTPCPAAAGCWARTTPTP